jgi:peptide/nickel transport system substrate-binding protein
MVVLAAAGLAVSAAACGGGATDAAPSATTSTSNPADPWVPGLGGTLTVGIASAPTGCNPNSAAGNTWADHLVLEPVLPSAFFVGPDGTATYDSAVITQAEVVSTKPQTVVYTINPRAVWSDGVPISAADFEYAWREQRGQQADGTGSSTEVATTLGYSRIRSVTGSNRGRTVTVVFKKAFADWKMLFADLLPAHVMEQVGWDPGCTSVDPRIDVSGGPFEIEKVTPGHEVVLQRNPEWWGTLPNLDSIVIRTGNGPGQLARWIDHRTIEVALPKSFTSSFLEQVSSNPSVQSASEVSSTLLQLEYSTTSALTGALAVREAISHMVDRQAIVNSVAGPINTSIVPAASHLFVQSQQSYPGQRPVPLQLSTSPGHSTTTTTTGAPTPAQPWPVGSDPGAAARELEGASFGREVTGRWIGPDGQPVDLRLAVDTRDGWAREASAVLVRQLREQGIGVTIVAAPNAESAGLDLANGAADAALLPYEVTPYPSTAIAWYTTLLGPPGVGGSQNWSNFDNPTLDATLLRASTQLNPVDAGPLYTKADTMLWDQMVALPLFAEPTAMAWSAYTAGIGINPNGPSLFWSTESWGLRVPATSPDTAPAT